MQHYHWPQVYYIALEGSCWKVAVCIIRDNFVSSSCLPAWCNYSIFRPSARGLTLARAL